MGSFNGLIKAEFTPPRTWVLSRELSFRTDALSKEEVELLQISGANCSSAGEIFVKPGFNTDLASVPRALWAFISPWDIARSAIIHDHLYACCRDYFESKGSNKDLWKKIRKAADKVFMLAMNAAEPPVPQWKKKSAYYAVRAFGGKAAKGGVILPNDELNC